MTTISNSDLKTYLGVLVATINSNFRRAKQNTPPEILATVSSSSTNANPVGAKCAYDALSLKQNTSNLVTSVSASSTDAQYPSAKLFYDTVGNIESALNTINSGV